MTAMNKADNKRSSHQEQKGLYNGKQYRKFE